MQAEYTAAGEKIAHSAGTVTLYDSVVDLWVALKAAFNTQYPAMTDKFDEEATPVVSTTAAIESLGQRLLTMEMNQELLLDALRYIQDRQTRIESWITKPAGEAEPVAMEEESGKV